MKIFRTAAVALEACVVYETPNADDEAMLGFKISLMSTGVGVNALTVDVAQRWPSPAEQVEMVGTMFGSSR